MLSPRSFPRAILHIDGDAFFASCEAAVNPKLKGKPLVTGKERGIASSLSYELRAMGVKRGMPLWEIKKICPEVIIVPSDYETYSLFSKRMYDIVRRYTPEIEEYSIDECFADLTGLRRLHHMPYEKIAEQIKHELDTELGMTFSIGLAPTKTLAKVASKWKKPNGLTIIPGNRVEEYLKALPIDKVWGIGSQTTAYLNKLGVQTALQYVQKPKEWLETHHMSKPYKETWAELRGEFIMPLSIGEKHDYQSISKTKTFTPPSTDREFIFSQLSKNIENACIKARRHNLAPKKIFFFLKTQEFKYSGLELTLTARLSMPNEIIRMVKDSFDRVYRPRVKYRASGIVLIDLETQENVQLDLFGRVADIEKWRPVYDAVDQIDAKFGKHTIYLGSTMRAVKNGAHLTERGDEAGRATRLMRGENKRQRIGIPMLGQVK